MIKDVQRNTEESRALTSTGIITWNIWPHFIRFFSKEKLITIARYIILDLISMGRSRETKVNTEQKDVNEKDT